jgi:hypothetical protein
VLVYRCVRRHTRATEIRNRTRSWAIYGIRVWLNVQTADNVGHTDISWGLRAPKSEEGYDAEV